MEHLAGRRHAKNVQKTARSGQGRPEEPPDRWCQFQEDCRNGPRDCPFRHHSVAQAKSPACQPKEEVSLNQNSVEELKFGRDVKFSCVVGSDSLVRQGVTGPGVTG